ncbi:MAG: type II/IV secretion system protein [candidate division WOR-3 bacterium]
MKEQIIDYLKEFPEIFQEYQKASENKNFDLVRFFTNLISEKKLKVDEKLAKLIEQNFKITYLDAEKIQITEGLLTLFIPSYIKKNRFIPFEVSQKKIKIITDNPFNLELIKDIQFITNLDVDFYITTTESLNKKFIEIFGQEKFSYELDENVLKVDEYENLEEEVVEDDEINAKPIVRLINSIIIDAIKLNASDIHFEPQSNNLVVRYRIDGFLQEHLRLPKKIEKRVISRIKIMAKMDITITRKAQDGNIQIVVSQKDISLRVSTIPIMDGEKIVIRILDKSKIKVSLEQLGLTQENIFIIRKNANKSQGIILVTGPTGSGKTTTLYSILQELDYKHLNITTIEDPIEYTIKGINQTQIDPKNNVTFSSALRTLLRQDPNVILLGEIRDTETAQTAFKGAITGHLLLSTLHTNSEISTLIRLRDLGVEPYLISDALLVVIAQRIVRKVCKFCSTKVHPDERVKKILKVDENFEIYQENKYGCEKCNYTGFSGIIGIFGVLEIDQKLRELIEKDANLNEIVSYLKSINYKTVFDDGLDKVKNGITTFSEIERVLDVDRFLIENSVTLETKLKSVTEKKSILVVDDIKTIRTVICALFKSEGFETFEAENGVDALEILKNNRIDLVITDLSMPQMGGFELLEKIKNDENLKSIPVVVLTSKSDSENEIEGLSKGADDYIPKPIDPQKVLLRIKNILKRSGC